MPESVFIAKQASASALDWQPSVVNIQTTPPGAPTVGDRYIVLPLGTGLWVGQDNDIATWNGTVWEFTTPENGWAAYAETPELIYIFDGSTWNAQSTAPAFRLSFTNATLAAGVLTVTHNLGQLTQQVTVSDENDEVIGPDLITFVDVNTLSVDLSSFGTITGTWNVVVGD